MNLAEMSLDELLKDRKESEEDIIVCERALSLTPPIETYSGGSVKERLNTNKKILSIIDEELKRRCSMFYQQGDVIVEKVSVVKGKKLNHLTLAEGEATGHHHTITKGDAELYEENGTFYLHVETEATLTHQEHDTVVLPKGDYVVRKVREFDHFKEEARDVAD